MRLLGMPHPLSVGVVEAVAEAEGVEPTELGFRLEDHVDTDCLDRLYDNDARWTLSFELPDHTVTVSDDGRIVVDTDRTEFTR